MRSEKRKNRLVHVKMAGTIKDVNTVVGAMKKSHDDRAMAKTHNTARYKRMMLRRKP